MNDVEPTVTSVKTMLQIATPAQDTTFWFSLTPDERDQVRAFVCIPVSEEMAADSLGLPSWGELFAQAEEAERAFRALPAAEQARILAEREAQREADRAVREAERCPHCGCHPDEHGDDGW